jgi:hypothetical protein
VNAVIQRFTRKPLMLMEGGPGVSSRGFAGGVFNCLDSQATSYPRRFYRVLKP